jgi:hypothetical protein
MIKLMIGAPGSGKSHWLQQQHTDITIECTHKSHRSILFAVANIVNPDRIHMRRMAIDELIEIILQAPWRLTIGLDDIDRTSPRLLYSLITLSNAGHNVLATATDQKRVKPLLDRQAAIIMHPPQADIRAILQARYPDLDKPAINRIASLTTTPAAAINTAECMRAGQPLPQPPARDWSPLITLVALTAIYFLRHILQDPAITASLIAASYIARRFLWRRS